MAERRATFASTKRPAGAFYVVAIAASAGGLAALREIFTNLPPAFPAAVLVVQHLDPKHRSVLAEIIGRCTTMPVHQARDNDAIEPGHVLIAPPAHHMVVGRDGAIHLVDTALVNFVRPSADRLFQSTAECFREHCIVVVLTGTGSDGSTALDAVKKSGGIVIAQDQMSSEFGGMPKAATDTGDVDFVAPLSEIPALLCRLVAAGVD